MSEREVQRSLLVLQDLGELAVHYGEGQHGTNYYVMIKMARPHCWYCGLDLHMTMVTVDHQKPKAKGGTDALRNLVYACSPCNTQKHGLTLEEFRKLRKVTLFFGEHQGCQNVTRPSGQGRQIQQRGVTNPVKPCAEMSPEPSEVLTVQKDKEELYRLIEDYNNGKTHTDEHGRKYKVSPSSRERIYV